MNRSKQRSIFSYLFICLSLAMALLVVACGSDEPAEPETQLEEITLPTPTPKPTLTPVPTPTPTTEPTPLPEEIDEETGEVIPSEAEEVVEEEIPDEFTEPEFVSINFRQGTVNDWVEIQPPPGWIVSAGLDGMLISQEPDSVPEASFALVRRWGNVVSTGDWVAYLPDGVEERNSNVTIRMGGYDWDGVFITTEDNAYRAFFAVSNETLPAFTVLVYVPMTPEDLAEGEDAYSRGTLLEKWDANASELNTILRRFLFS